MAPKHLLNAGFLLGCFSTLKMEVIRSSETSINIRTTPRYILEDGNIHSNSFSVSIISQMELIYDNKLKLPNLTEICILSWAPNSSITRSLYLSLIQNMSYIQRITERCGQTLDTSYTYRNKKNMSIWTFHLWVIAERAHYNNYSERPTWDHEMQCTPRHRLLVGRSNHVDNLTGIHNATVKCLFVVKKSCIHKGFRCSS
jgi:hypothetical protein